MEIYEKIDEVAKAIGLSPSTIKKYYGLFEQQGYKFKRSIEGHVLFSQHDIELLKELVILKNESGMTVIKAIKQILLEEGITGTTDTTDLADMTGSITAMSKQITSVMTELSEVKELLKQQNEAMQQQQKYIENSLDRRDKMLMEAIREQQETKRLMIESQKEIAASVQQQLENKKKWREFWK
jgi:DNA-binding transcriptional MerR regulator